MGDVIGGLKCANRGAALEAGLGRVGDGQRRLWGSGEAVMLLGVSLCPRPQGRGLERIGGVPRPL
jgi:hypothetical protein